MHRDVYDAISPSGLLNGSAKDQVVIVTGAGRGIGRAQAIAFAQAGAKKVVIAARSSHELDEVEQEIVKVANHTTVMKVVTDVTDEQSVNKLFEHTGDVTSTIIQLSTYPHRN
jgi:NAD(P)-dependent dehydrogenase (short-subunit alcohol dehydrogenase family)